MNGEWRFVITWLQFGGKMRFRPIFSIASDVKEGCRRRFLTVVDVAVRRSMVEVKLWFGVPRFVWRCRSVTTCGCYWFREIRKMQHGSLV